MDLLKRAGWTLPRWAALGVAGLALYILWALIFPESPGRGIPAAIAVVIYRAGAAAAFLGLARSEMEPNWGRLWRYLAVGVSFWAISETIELGAWLARNEIQLPPSPADWIRLAGHLAAIAAVASHPSTRNQRWGRIRDLLDNAILSLAVLTLAWLVVLRAVLSIELARPIAVLWTGLAPALDLVMISLLIKLILQSEADSERRPFFWMAAGVTVLGLSDWAQGYLTLQREGAGGTLLEAGLIGGALLLSVAPSSWRAAQLKRQVSATGSTWARLARRFEPLLPIAFTYAVVGMTAVDWWLTGEVDQIAMVAAAALSVLLVARQGAILGQSELRGAFEQVQAARSQLQALNLALEEKVSERTRELRATVADLARLNEELKQLDRMKNEFVALVSHELRSPLTNIRSGLELLLREEAVLPHDTREALELVHAESERLSHLVGTILDLSALEAGRFQLQPLAVPMHDIVSRVRSRFPDPSDKSRLHMHIPADLPPVKADERGLSSVFFHLLDNAIKYAPDGDISIEARAEDGTVEVSVSDQGPGIPEGEYDRVFDMFHRLDSRDSREIYGHGLGLHMAKRLLQAMGGGIRAEPNPEGCGARFVFWLPQAPSGSGEIA